MRLYAAAVLAAAVAASAAGAGWVAAQDATISGAVRLPGNVDRLRYDQADPIARIEQLHATVAALQTEVATLRLEMDDLKARRDR